MALVALSASAVPAAAQSVLVSNTGQTVVSTANLSNADAAQAFTTGPNPSGYTLTSVHVTFNSGTKTGVTVRIATGLPSSTDAVATLTNPATLVNNNAADYPFTAPANTTLAANTTYWVVVEGSAGTPGGTTSDAEDSGAFAGWSIADSRHRRAASSTGGWTTHSRALGIRVNGTPIRPEAPGAPTVAQGPTSGSLAVSWTAPTGSAITDYDLRYFKGTADPSSESDWVTEGVPGLSDATRTVPADTIRGLLASTAYRVQVRAANANGEGAWSPSGSATTAAAPATNNAPRVLNIGSVGGICRVETNPTVNSRATEPVILGQTIILRNLVTRGSETTEWPTSCTPSARSAVPYFDDRDAEQLLLTLDYTPPDPASARFTGGTPAVRQPAAQPTEVLATRGLVSLQALSAFSPDTVRINITATDPHGASATTWIRVILEPVAATAGGAPRFTSTASPPAYPVNEAIAPFVLPAATGGTIGTVPGDPYFYRVSGLPPGLTFDAATRTISGTPTSAGSHRVTYKADDPDVWDEDDGDTAVQTFNIVVRGDGSTDPPPAPTGLTVAQGPTSGSLAVSWTPPPTGSAIADYDLRYFKGTADPSSESDWVTEGVPGLSDATRTVPADTIRGLLASTAYRVQVRAANANGEGAWSPSGSATTAAAPATNNAPRVLNIGSVGGICRVETNPTVNSRATEPVILGQTIILRNLVTRGSETTEWPTSCTPSARSAVPYFDDRDAEQLLLTLDYTPPDPASARFTGGTPAVRQPAAQPTEVLATRGLVSLQALSAFSPDTVRINITATDPHGASATTWIRVILEPVAATAGGAPRFTSTASPPAYPVNEAIAPFVLPAATGGTIGTVPGDPYFYRVSGLPPGLTFDAATRTISGTPTSAGSHRVTYKADDPDVWDEDDGDTAVQTFVIAVAGAGPAIRSLGIVSTPTIDTNSDGAADTYGVDDVIAVEVDFTETVTGAAGSNLAASAAHITLRLDLGTDDTDLTNSRKPVQLHSHSGSTVRFEYTVAATDTDADGVWVQTASATDDAVLFLGLPNVVIQDADGNNATLTLSGLPTSGDAGHKVDGSRTPPPAVTGAEVDGTKLTLTFNKKLNTANAPAASRFTVARTPAVTVSSVAFRAADSTKVDLTLSAAVRSGETGITVAYAKGDDANSLQNPSGTEAANFTGLAVTNLTPPTATAVEVNGTALTLTFDAPLNASTTPATTRFTVTSTVSGTQETKTVQAVAVSTSDATKLNLTVSPRVGPAEANVTVAYTAGTDTNPLQDAAGNKVRDFTGVSVTNATPPSVTDAEVDGTELTLTFDAALSATSTPAAARFTVARTSTPAPPAVTVTAAAFRSGDATKLELTLSEAVRSGETGITVAYAKAGDANPLQKPGGVEVADFTGQAVTNVTPPSVTDAEVDGAALELTFDAALSTTATPEASRFTVSGIAAAPTVSSVAFRSGDATKLELTLSAAAGSTDTDVRLAYAAGTDANALQDAAGRQVKDFTGLAVRNPASGVPSFPPEAPTTLSVRENSAAGTLVGTVAATDPGGDALTYALASTESGGTDHQSFAIGTNDGRITVASGAVLNYEAKTSYAVPATASDGTFTASRAVTIRVRNVQEPPSAPAAPAVTRASATSLTVTWSPPSNAGARAVFDYDLRYYEGTSDPSNASDWIQEGEANGPPNPGASNTATITGLTENGAYRVQVRAQGDGESPWSASGGTSGGGGG
ncbi:MAG: hypothetical protein F4213_08105, partial [Boseongicola sp. SB0677_bin_26]|nr:hypothetical protein [Boseongicola sp. SB0677_bin_26]